MRHLLATTLIFSSILFPAVASASSSTDDAVEATANLRVSTGVTAPSLSGTIALQLSDSLPRNLLAMDSQVGLTLTVDSNGLPQNVKVVKSSNPFLDARVVDAIQKSHFTPGTVDNTSIPVDVDLTVNVVR